MPFVVETVGRTEGSKEVELRARVSGILQKQLYAEGATVAAGAVLFRIDPAPFEIALAHAQASLAEEQARNSQAKRNANRLKELLAKNLISHNDADNAISTLEASDAAILAAQAKVREAELNLSYTKVAAPIGGITGRALHSEGSLVTAGTESGLLTTVTQADPVWARFALSAGEFEGLRAATQDARNTKRELDVQLVKKDGTPYPQRGKVNFAASTVDNNLGTVQLRAEFANKGLGLLPGEYVRVRLSGGQQPAITVPQTAVLQGAKGPFVWVVNGAGQAEQRLVKTGAWIGEEWRITDGLQANDTVILDNLLKLRPGAPVTSNPPLQSGTAPAPTRTGG
jgi:membrane fusion protein, multidrug efflux system